MKKLPKAVRLAFVSILALVTLGSIVLAILYFSFTRDLPNLITMKDYRPAIVTQIHAVHGDKSQLIGEFYKERRYVVAYEEIPQKLVEAFVAAEDDQFFQHQGVNFMSIARASIANFRAGHVVQGGSTITQQVAKSLMLTPEKSFSRKLKELILASQMERNLGKQEILSLYLNQIYLGHGAYGVKAAAIVYFNKELKDLTIAECALIAGMPTAPSKFSPHLNPKKAKERQVYVLRRMVENRFITPAEFEKASKEELPVHDSTSPNNEYSPYLVEHIRRYVIDKYGEKALYEDGLQVVVRADPRLLKTAGAIVKQGLRDIDRRSGYRGIIKHLKTDEEIRKRIEHARIQVVMRELGYEVLKTNGTLEVLDAVQLAGLKAEADLLKPGQLYEGVVTSFDDKRKNAGILVGAIKVNLPIEEARWALRGKPMLDNLLHKGDVVWVRPLKREGEGWTVSLEQVPEIQAALFSIDARTGQVLAMEGGYDYSKSEFNRATQAQRQMGSAFKPIIFSAALEKGYTPASIVVDAPIVYNDKDFGKWKPTNFEEKFYGDTTFRQALIKSRNIPTIKIVQDVGVGRVVEFSKRIGMPAALNPDLSIALGSATMSLVEMTRVYSVFPRAGRKVEPVFFSVIKDRDGKTLEEKPAKPIPPVETVMNEVKAALASEAKLNDGEPEDPAAKNSETISKKLYPHFPLEKDPEQVLDPRVAYVATHLMKEVVSFGTGTEAKQLGRPAAGKTGTTNEYQDAWFMGFTPQVVTGVWVGFDASKSIGSGETGARAALPIWLEFMKEAVKDLPVEDFDVPPGVSFVSIHPQTGKPTAPNASYSIKEAFVDGTQPVIELNNAGQQITPRSTSEFLKEDIE